MALHPQVVQLLTMMKESGMPPLHEMPLAQAREVSGQIRDMVGPGPEVAEIRDLRVPTPDGGVPARLYRTAQEPAAGLVVYLHGGGWVIGGLDEFDTVCQILAAESGFDVLSVDYRVAPEHRFPCAVDDAFAALRWAADELAEGRPLVIAGDSSGANLAAICAQLAKAEGGPPLALQVLAYPVTDHDFSRSSYIEHGDSGYLVGRQEMIWFWDLYLPDVARRSDPLASPLRAEDLSGLAPALVFVAEYDPLRDEGLAYAEKLREAGVPVTLRHYDDVIHGFFTMPNVLERGNQALSEAAQAIREAAATRAG